MKILLGLIALFSLFLMSACSSLTVEPTPTPSATASLTSTWTLIPTLTATLTPTVTFTPTATPTKTLTPTMTPTPTRGFFGMNTPFPADQLELTVIKAWLTDEGITVTIPKVRLNYIEPEFAYLLVRINVSGLDGATIGMEFVQRELFVQFADKETINCRVIIVGGINNASAVIKGIMPGSKIGTLPENFSGLYKEGVADYMFWLTYEPDLNDELYFYWGETPPVKLILTVEE